MPEAAHKPDTLEAQAAALVNNAADGIDLDALAAEALDDIAPGTANQAPPPAPPAEAALQNMDELAKAVEQLLSDAAANAPVPEAEPGATAAAPSPATKGEPVTSDSPAAPTTTAGAPEPIKNLDSRIAEQADDMIAGEFADEQNEIKGQIGAPPPPPPPAEPSALPPRPAPAPEPVPAAAVPDIPVAPRPAAPTPVNPAVRPAKAESKKRSGPPKLLAALGAPLSRRSKQTRDLVGWAAIITILNASCLWGYLMFFRSATPAVAKAPAHPPADDGHGAKDDGHAKDSHAKDAKDSHGKAPTKTAEKKPAEKKTTPKKSAKKDASASHGGH